MVRPISVNSSREMPCVNTMGRNTHMVVSVEAKIAPDTCFAPWMAALEAGTPRERRR